MEPKEQNRRQDGNTIAQSSLHRPRLIASLVLFALALLASASTWFYMNRIFVPQQVADAAEHNKPRGNLSDLYPRWIGSRELLLHGRNPYSWEVTREIQRGYYGRLLDPARPDDPRDQQGFAYPVYVVFLLAPTVRLPFTEVQIGFRWLLYVLVIASVWLWLRVVQWKTSLGILLTVIVLMLGWLPTVQGLKLEQLSLLVAALLAACCASLSSGWLVLSGCLLAIATMKPQLAWPLVLWLLVWAGSAWRTRWKFVLGFGVILLLLLAGAEVVLPGWLRMFVAAIGEYRRYTHSDSVLVPLMGHIAARTVVIVSFLASAACLWRFRSTPAPSAAFGRTIGLVLALTVLIMPMSALYNQVLLLPAILIVARSALCGEFILPAVKLARNIATLFVAWPWIATLGLTLAFFAITPAIRRQVWLAPFYSSLMLPVFVFLLALYDAWMFSTSNLLGEAVAEYP